MKNLKVTIQSSIVLTASALLVFGAFKMIGSSHAAASSLTGKCGVVFNVRTSADGQLGDTNEATINAGGVIDFDNNKISISTSRQKAIYGGTDIWTQLAFLNRDLTISADPDSIPSAYKVSFMTNSDTVNFRVIPVNSGNTFLIQGLSLGTTGVCQKL